VGLDKPWTYTHSSSPLLMQQLRNIKHNSQLFIYVHLHLVLHLYIMEINKDLKLQTQFFNFKSQIFISLHQQFTPLITIPSPYFVSSICPHLHHHILDTTTITKSSTTNHKLEKETQLCLQHSSNFSHDITLPSPSSIALVESPKPKSCLITVSMSTHYLNT